METLVANITGKVRRETLDGRRYLVAPVVLMQGGSVMNGSKGALYYPPEECAREPGMWNNVPITDGHPVENGYPVSARSPEVLAKYKLGYIFNDRWDGSKRTAEAWYDEELTRNKSPKTYDALEANRPFDLSTGLMTDNVLAANGSQAKGKAYSHIARNYRPDHVASLVGQTGACSLRDGCGVLVGNVCEECSGDPTDNAFCPTGEGGGQDNSCSSQGGTNVIKPGTPEYDAYLARQSAGMQKDLDKLNRGPKEKKLNAKQLKAKEDKEIRGKLEKMDQASVRALASKHGIDPSRYDYPGAHLYNLHSEMLREPAIRDSLLTQNEEGAVTNEEKRSLWRQLGDMLGITTTTEPEPKKIETINQEPTSTEGDAMPTKKEELVSYLTTNCSCHKGKEKVLNTLDEETLAVLKTQHEELAANQLVVNALRESDPTLKDIAVNELPAAFKKKSPTAAKETCPDCGYPVGPDHVCPPKKTTMNKLAPASERLTPEEIETLEIAREVTQNSKSQLLDLVVNANASNDAAKKAIRPLYEKLSYKELKTLADNLPKGRPTTNDDHGDLLLNFFTGASGGGHHTTNRGSEPDPNDVLEPFYTPAKS